MNEPLQHFLEYYDKMTLSERKEFLKELPFDDLLEDWDDLEKFEAEKIFVELPLEVKTDLIYELPNDNQEHLILGLTEKGKKELFEMMEPDDLVDIMQSVSKEVRDAVWKSLTDDDKREMLFLLRFDEDDAAGIMTPRFMAVQAHTTVGQAINFIRANCDTVEFLFGVYVIDQLERLTGFVTIKDLLASKDDRRISEIITEQKVIYAYEDTDQEEVAKLMETHDLASIPVVNHDHILIGIVTFDDIIDVIREEQTEDVYKMGGMATSDETYLHNTVWDLVKMRVPWLIILLLLGTISANVLNHYESVLIGGAFLVIFMPVITQTGGNAGSQASTLMIRGLATGDIVFKDIAKILTKELLIGILMGVITGGVIVIRSIFLPPGVGIYEGMVIGLSLMIVVFISNLIGILAPLGIARLGKDPTVMSAPLMATVIDICGYAIYFETARWLLDLG